MPASRAKLYLLLVGANFIYACESIFTKLASMQPVLSFGYLAFVACAVAVLGIYAILWQQIIKRMPVGEAYMFKGTSLIFVLIISVSLFGERITAANLIGAALIVGGIALFSKE